MKLEDIASLAEAEVIFRSSQWDHIDIQTGCSSDLMSDILTLDVTNAVLITGLANEQAVRTAEIAEINAIILVRSKTPSESMLELSRKSDISLMKTRHTMFTICGRLMEAGLQSPY